jgi:hypothetical protein
LEKTVFKGSSKPKEPKNRAKQMQQREIKLNAINHITVVRHKIMAKEKKRQVCFRIEDSIVNEMEQIRDKTGVPVSTQIELRLKGYAITNLEKEGNSKGILRWYQNLQQDEDYAKDVDEAVERMRELKLH